jgi:hypothetical protein
VFSEKDLPGYKPKGFSWDEVDEDGNPGQGRSFLYERHRREQKKKENKGRFVPYSKRPIPKQTAIAGTIVREFEAVPVKNDEYFALENKRTAQLLKVREQEEADFRPDDDGPEKQNRRAIYTSRVEAQAQAKVRGLSFDFPCHFIAIYVQAIYMVWYKAQRKLTPPFSTGEASGQECRKGEPRRPRRQIGPH